MGNRNRIGWLLLLLPLVACTFDHDSGYLPQWKATWWVLQDDSGAHSWVRIDTTSVLTGLTGGTAIAIQADERGLWALEEGGRVSLRDRIDGEVERQWHTPDGLGTDLTLGLSRVFVSTAEAYLWVLDPEKERWHEVTMAGPSGYILARSDRCFVQVDDTVVVKVQEQSLAVVETIILNFPILSFDHDGGHFTYASHSSPEGLRLSRLSYHPDVMNALQKVQAADQILINPLLRQTYGTEYLGDLIVENGCLTGLSGICGDHFWPIWEEAEVLVLRADSLFRYDLETGARLYEYGRLSGELKDGVNVVE